MKRLFMTLLLFIGLLAYSQQIIYLNDATLAWDAVTELSTGDPIPITDTVEYELYESTYPVDDPQNPAAHNFVALTALTQYDVTILQDSVEHAYGIRTKLTTDGETTILFSDINWSFTDGLATPDPFLYRAPSIDRPKLPMGLRTQ